MNKEESNIVCELNLDDFKYLSVRFLFFNWFFPVGAEVANQLLDNIIKLYLKSGIHISRSQARRVLSGLEKFKIVVFDFDKVPMIGQSFADEIFRVFQSKHPKIQIEAINMNEAVRFMIDRVE